MSDRRIGDRIAMGLVATGVMTLLLVASSEAVAGFFQRDKGSHV